MFYLLKKQTKLLTLLCLVTFLLWQNYYWYKINSEFKNIQSKVLYSKDNNIQKELLKTIEQAEQYIHFSIYTFTSEEIAAALIAAKLKGLEVKGIMDQRQAELEQEKPILRKLRVYGIAILIPQKNEGIMHTKFLVTEKGYASGSYNWTFSANNNNDEVIEIGRTENTRRAYEKIFQNMEKKYTRNTEAAS